LTYVPLSVIIEKPLTPTFAEAQELISIAKAKNLVLAVYQNRRWDSDMLTLKSLLDKGSFGELSEFEVSHRRIYSTPRNLN